MRRQRRQRIGKSGGVLRLSWQDGKTLPLGDRCGCRQSDQAALTLPVRGIIFLFEPLVQRQVCLAVLRRILVSVVQRHRQDVQKIFQIPTVQAIGRMPYRSRRLSNAKDCGRSSVWRFSSLRSTPAIRNGCLRSYLPGSFRHSVTEKCHSAARPLADPASGSLASHPFTAAGHSATDDRHRV